MDIDVNKKIEHWLRKLNLDTIVSSKTLTNLSTLFTGTVLAATIPILFAPVMSRIYTSTDYGVLGLYMSISGLIGVIAYMHYPQAIMLSKDDNEARQVMWFSIFFCLGIAFLTLIIILLLHLFNILPTYSPLKIWLFLIPLSVLLNGISASVMVWANRHQQYKVLASNRMLQAILTVIIQISLGLSINNEAGLLVGLIGGQMISVFLLWLRFTNKSAFALKRPEFTTFRSVAFQHRKLLIYTTPSEFINNLINQTPIFLLQRFGGLSYVGSYNFTQRILGMPQVFLSSAIVEVFKQKASVAYNTQGNCKEIFVKTFKVLCLMAIIPFSVIILFAPNLFVFVFGHEWKEAGLFAQFLGILFFLRFIVSPLSYVYIIVGRVKEDFLLHILFLTVTTLSFYIGNMFIKEKPYLILIYSITYSCIYLIYLIRSFKFSRGVS